MPWFALLAVVVIAGIGFAVRRWSTAPRLAATVEDEDVVDRERHREDGS